ncbi:MAG: hypothetical protein NDI90_21740 [Nitrospira sp. BO4]|jgi:hypothetical protein|nr:hypothetical protein [Nitrospira sp. BO4]
MNQSKLFKPRLQRAGGFQICDGGPGFKLVKRRTMQKWRKAVKQVLLSARKNDPAIEKMILDCATEWGTYSCPDYQSWSSLTPLEKQQALFAWILRQKQRSTVEILVAGIAGDLYTTYGPQALKTPYARAVNIGRSVWFRLRQEYRTYEHDSGHGSTRIKHICITRKVRIRSRNACQRIEVNLVKHGMKEFVKRYGDAIASRLL